MSCRLNLFLAFICFMSQSMAQSPKRIALSKVNVVDVVNGKIIKNQVVIIENDRIAKVIPVSSKPDLSNCQVIATDGKFLMPGLIDTHLHLFYFVKTNKRDELKLAFKLMLANGITGIREAGASVYTQEMISVRDSLNKKYFPGPRMYVSGIATSTNLKKFQVTNYSELVDTFGKIGVDGIKIKFATLKESIEIIDAAKRHHLSVYGHTFNTWRNETKNILGDFTMEAIDHGVSGVMHMGFTPVGNNKLPPGPEPTYSSETKLWKEWWLYFDALWLYANEGAEKELINNMVRKKIWLEPTLSIGSYNMNYHALFQKKALQYYFGPDSSLIEGFPQPEGKQLDTSRLAFRRQQLFVKRFYDAGGLLLAGTDGSLYGSDLKDELHYLSEAGIPATAVIKIVTYNNALALGWLNDMGTVEKGKLANLVLLTNNPLHDINNLENIEAVFSNGNYYGKEILDNWLEQIEKAALKAKK